MRYLTTIISIAIACALLQSVLPWWSIAIASFVVSLLTALRPGRAFIAGFSGVALWWLILGFIRDVRNEHILSSKLAALFHLPGYISYLFFAMIIGGLTGGVAATAAAMLNRKR